MRMARYVEMKSFLFINFDNGFFLEKYDNF